MEKIKLCWKWNDSFDVRLRWNWLEGCAAETAAHYDIHCEEQERLDWEDFGVQAANLPGDWGRAEQALLLAMVASGEAQAVVWIDDSPGGSNLTSYVIELCRDRSIPLAVEPSGAAAMLWALARVRQAASGQSAADPACKPNQHVFEFELGPKRHEAAAVHGVAPDLSAASPEPEPAEFDDIVWFSPEAAQCVVHGEASGEPANALKYAAVAGVLQVADCLAKSSPHPLFASAQGKASEAADQSSLSSRKTKTKHGKKRPLAARESKAKIKAKLGSKPSPLGSIDG